MEFSHLSKSQDVLFGWWQASFFRMFHLCFTTFCYVLLMFYLCFTILFLCFIYVLLRCIYIPISFHLFYHHTFDTTVNKKKPRPFCSSSPGCCKSLTSNSSPRPHKRQFFRSSEWECDMWKPWICFTQQNFLWNFQSDVTSTEKGHPDLVILNREWSKSLTIHVPHLGTFH